MNSLRDKWPNHFRALSILYGEAVADLVLAECDQKYPPDFLPSGNVLQKMAEAQQKQT